MPKRKNTKTKQTSKTTNKRIVVCNENELRDNDTYDCIILNTNFNIKDINNCNLLKRNNRYIKQTIKLIKKLSERLCDGGLLYVYGLPKYLPFFAEHLNDTPVDNFRFLFKYWIAIGFKPQPFAPPIPNSHIGLLMYLKTISLRNPTPFNLNTKTVRVPYEYCPSCKEITKDWGGKKHLINPLGSAISDVWSASHLAIQNSNKIPTEIVNRIYELQDKTKNTTLLIYQTNAFPSAVCREKPFRKKSNVKETTCNSINDKFIDKVIHADSFKLMRTIANKFPNGFFDLAFADPPYNLAKQYSVYDDELHETKYVKWCNSWLKGMYNVLKPGGVLAVLNIPKWSIYHAVFLSQIMQFRYWIVWDALSTPSGKVLPAHYSLLCFTKPGANPIIERDDLRYVDDRKYCLRASCVKKRKESGNDDKELMSDVWKDIHRIKHKKHRDHHPCQLPISLMHRIVELFSPKGGLVFDPFGGAGSTAISAKLLKRHYTISDVDKHYVEVSQNNLDRIQENLFGELQYERTSLKGHKKSNSVPNKLVETKYIDLCFKEKKVLTLDELETINVDVAQLIKQYNGKFNNLMKICRRKFENEKIIKKGLIK